MTSNAYDKWLNQVTNKLRAISRDGAVHNVYRVSDACCNAFHAINVLRCKTNRQDKYIDWLENKLGNCVHDAETLMTLGSNEIRNWYRDETNDV